MCYENNEVGLAVTVDTVSKGVLFEGAHQSIFFGLQVTKSKLKSVKAKKEEGKEEGRKEKRERGREEGRENRGREERRKRERGGMAVLEALISVIGTWGL